MTIAEIITKYYGEFKKILKDPDRMVAEGKTDEDYLQDVCMTALKKYKNRDIDELEGAEYLFKNLRMEMKFKYHRKDKNITYIEDTPEVSNL